MSTRSHPERPSHTTPVVVPVVEEQLDIGIARQARGAVRVRIEVDERPERIEGHEYAYTASVSRVVREVAVDDVRAPWKEGDTLVVPVYEERVVVQRQLVLKEEVRIDRHASRVPVDETVPLRSERAIVERLQPDGRWAPIEPDELHAPATPHRSLSN